MSFGRLGSLGAGFGRLGGSRGAPAAPAYNYFIDNGSTAPWYGDTHQPAEYYADINKTLFMWETSVADKRYAQARFYNHATETYEPVYAAGLNSVLVDDDHGCPSRARDSEGYIYCFYGAHGFADNNNWWSVTNAANNISAWTEKTSFTGYFTYPTCDVISDDMYLFYRGGTTSGNADQNKYGVFVATSVTGGNPTWGSWTSLIDFGTDAAVATARFYSGTHEIVGGKIHIFAAWADNANTFREDVFCFVYDPADGSLSNLAGTTTIAAVSLPIDATEARTNFRLVNQRDASHRGGIPITAVDTAGNIHIVYRDGEVGGPFSLLHRVWDGDTLSSPTTVGTMSDADAASMADRYCIAPLPNGEIDVYWVTENATLVTWGGDISVRRRAANGTWGTETLVQEAGATYPLNYLCAVKSAHANARVIWCESVIRTDWAATESARLKCFAYGDAGYLKRPMSQVDRYFDYTTISNVVRYYDAQAEGRMVIDSSGNCSAWLSRERASGNWTQGTSAQRPAFSLTGWDGTLPCLTGDGLATDGDCMVAGAPFGEQYVFIVAERSSADQNTSATSSLRPMYQMALSSGGVSGWATVLSPAVDAEQDEFRTQGTGAGATVSTAPDAFAKGDKAVLYAKFKDNDLRASVGSGEVGDAADFGATTKTAVGLFGESSSAERRFKGKIGAVLVLSAEPSAADKAYIINGLTRGWGIAA